MSKPQSIAMRVAATNWSRTTSMSARVIGRRRLVDRRPGHVARRHHRPIAVVERDVVPFPAELGRALAARMAELEADLRLRIGVAEVDDLFPRGDMLVVPHAGAAGADPAFGRDAGHLGEDEPRAADRALARWTKWKSLGVPSTAEYIAIGETVMRFSSLHVAQLERREHRRRGLVRTCRRSPLPEPALDRLEPFAVAQAQVLVADALAAREQRISELQRLEVEIAIERLEPFGRVARAVLELQHFEVPLGLIFVERGFEARPRRLSTSASLIASSSASLVPEPIEKCAVCAASPSRMTLPLAQRSHLMRRKLSQAAEPTQVRCVGLSGGRRDIWRTASRRRRSLSSCVHPVEAEARARSLPNIRR